MVTNKETKDIKNTLSPSLCKIFGNMRMMCWGGNKKEIHGKRPVQVRILVSCGEVEVNTNKKLINEKEN